LNKLSLFCLNYFQNKFCFSNRSLRYQSKWEKGCESSKKCSLDDEKGCGKNAIDHLAMTPVQVEKYSSSVEDNEDGRNNHRFHQSQEINQK